MANWGDGYRQGYRNAARKLLYRYERDSVPDELIEEMIDIFMNQINKEDDGSPSYYAVANHCCGGVDAHSGGCRW